MHQDVELISFLLFSISVFSIFFLITFSLFTCAYCFSSVVVCIDMIKPIMVYGYLGKLDTKYRIFLHSFIDMVEFDIVFQTI